MRNFIVVTLVLALGVLGFVVIRQQCKIAGLKKDLGENPSAGNFAPVPEVVQPKVAVEPQAEPAAPHEAAPLAARETPPAVAASPAGEKPANMFAAMGSMMTNPAMKEMIRTQTEVQLAMQYSALYTYLNLPPDKLESLRTLLMDRQMAMMDAGLALMGGQATDEERKQKSKDMEQTTASFAKQIEQLLGADDYDVFKQYEATQAERSQVEMFKRSIAASPDALTEKQENDLVMVMYAARTNMPLRGLEKGKLPDSADPSQLTEEKLSEVLKHTEALQSSYADTAAKILTPAQLTQFRNFMAQQRALQEMGIKMAAQMFGKDKLVPTPAPGQPSAP